MHRADPSPEQEQWRLNLFSIGTGDNVQLSYDDLESKMMELRAMHSRYHEKLNAIRRTFFKEHFPFEVAEGVRDQVMIRLRREAASR